MDTSYRSIKQELGGSPSEIAKQLLDYEMTNQQTARELLDQIHSEFTDKDALVNGLITPAFFNIADRLVKPLKLEEFGFSPSEIVKECQTFTYEDEEKYTWKFKFHKDDNSNVVQFRTKDTIDSTPAETGQGYSDNVIPIPQVFKDLGFDLNQPNQDGQITGGFDGYTGTTQDSWQADSSSDDKVHRFKNLEKTATNDAMKFAFGQAIIMLLKGLYYELRDALKHGIHHGFNTESAVDAFKLRCKRVFEYTIRNANRVLSFTWVEFIKSFFLSVLDMLIHLCTGIFQKAWEIIKEGFDSIIKAIKLLINPPADMSRAQLADAVVKIIATVVLNIIGFSLENWVKTLGIPDPFSDIVIAIFNGFTVALCMYLLDKIDLFDVKRQLRMQRVEEVFNARIEELKQNTANFNLAAFERLEEQRTQFDTLMSGLNSNDVASQEEAMSELKSFFGVETPYSDLESFKKYLDDNEVIKI